MPELFSSHERRVPGQIGAILLLVLMLGAPAVLASPSPLEANAPGRRGSSDALQVEIYINDVATELIAQMFRSANGRFSARRRELKEIGIRPPGRGGDDDLVALDNIPGLSMRFDEQAQVLHLTLAEEQRQAREYSPGAANEPLKQPIGVSRDFGMVLNYNAYGSAARGYSKAGKTFTTGSVTLESRAYSPFGTLQNTVIAGTGLTRQGVLRLDTSLTYAHRDTMLVGTLGDAISGGTAWSRPIRFGGGQISRQFSLRPDLVTAPMPSVSGSAAVPSTVDVFVDNVRIATQQVGAGPFRLNNLPVSSESGTARVVVRDVTGKETITSLPFFTASKLLAPGEFDFSIEGGAPRHSYAINSFDYSRKYMGMATARYGWNDWLSLEGHAEATTRLGVVGLGAAISAGQFGQFGLAGSFSYYRMKAGGLAYGSWQNTIKGVFVGVSSQRTFGRYEDVASVSAKTDISQQSTNLIDSGFYLFNRSPRIAKAIDRLTIGVPLSKFEASVAASLINIEREGEGRSHLVGLTYSQSFARKYNFFVSGYADLAARREAAVSAGLSFTFDKDLIATSSASYSRDTRNAGIDITRPMGPNASDYGWRVHDLEGMSPRRGASGAYKTQWARAEAGIQQDGKIIGGHGEVEGAIVATPSGIFASRRVNDSFAVVDVGVPGVEVLHENRPVGKTGWQGTVIVPDLHSFQRSKIAITPETMPGSIAPSLTETEIIPGYRSSSTVKVASIVMQDTARIELRDEAGAQLPAGTKLLHVETGSEFTIGYGGMAFLTTLSEDNTLEVRHGISPCRVRFSKADRAGPQGRIGPLTCRAGA